MHDYHKLISDAQKAKERLKLLELHNITDDKPLQRDNEDGEIEKFIDCQESYQNQLCYIKEALERLEYMQKQEPWMVDHAANMLHDTIMAAGEYCDSWGH